MVRMVYRVLLKYILYLFLSNLILFSIDKRNYILF